MVQLRVEREHVDRLTDQLRDMSERVEEAQVEVRQVSKAALVRQMKV